MDGHTRTGLHGAVRSMAASHRACSKASQPHQAIKQGDAASRSAACRRLTLSSARAAASADAVTHMICGLLAPRPTLSTATLGALDVPGSLVSARMVSLSSWGALGARCGALCLTSSAARSYAAVNNRAATPRGCRASAPPCRTLEPQLRGCAACCRVYRRCLCAGAAGARRFAAGRTAAAQPLRTPPTLPRLPQSDVRALVLTPQDRGVIVGRLARAVLSFQDNFLSRESSPSGLLCQVRRRRHAPKRGTPARNVSSACVCCSA